jgi:hypothetical protein
VIDLRKHVAHCDKCRASADLVATEIEAARAELAAAGWMELAQRGKGVARWLWWCPPCRPAPPKSHGFSTSKMP